MNLFELATQIQDSAGNVSRELARALQEIEWATNDIDPNHHALAVNMTADADAKSVEYVARVVMPPVLAKLRVQFKKAETALRALEAHIRPLTPEEEQRGP